MKSIRDYLAEDMWNHILMSGDAIRGCVTMESCKTKAEQLDYCRGITTMFPHMLLMNFSRWYFDAGMPKDYGAFMEASIAPLQEKVFPVLEIYFAEDSGLNEQEKGAMLIPVLTDLVPKYVLSGYHNYMFADSGKNIDEYIESIQPLLSASAKAMAAAYADSTTIEEKAEFFLYLGTRFPFLIIKRWYDWMFGKEEMKMPPPPPQG